MSELDQPQNTPTTDVVYGIIGMDEAKKVFSIVLYEGIDVYTPYAQLIANEVVSQFLSTNQSQLSQVAPLLSTIAKNQEKQNIAEQEQILKAFNEFASKIMGIIQQINTQYSKQA